MGGSMYLVSAFGGRVINPARRVVGAACLAVIADQASKYVVTHSSIADSPVQLIPYVHLQLVRNTGVAFSLFAGARWALVIVGALVLAGVVYAAVKSDQADRTTHISLGLIAGGAIGNMIDRIRLGAVVDFIDVGAWPTFNVADICIVIGVGLLLLRTMTARNDEVSA